eukprot:5104508-Pleurochrysis_carterae.AAC.1
MMSMKYSRLQALPVAELYAAVDSLPADDDVAAEIEAIEEQLRSFEYEARLALYPTCFNALAGRNRPEICKTILTRRFFATERVRRCFADHKAQHKADCALRQQLSDKALRMPLSQRKAVEEAVRQLTRRIDDYQKGAQERQKAVVRLADRIQQLRRVENNQNGARE